MNVFGVAALSTAMMPLLTANKATGGTASGRVVHIGSISGGVLTAGECPYAASKYALEALADAMRLELVSVFLCNQSPVICDSRDVILGVALTDCLDFPGVFAAQRGCVFGAAGLGGDGALPAVRVHRRGRYSACGGSSVACAGQPSAVSAVCCDER